MDAILQLKDGKHLSYRHVSGSKDINVVFMHGTLSDKNASKSLFLEQVCFRNNVSFTAFDFTGHGESSGRYTDGTIGIWFENALEIIDRITAGKLVLVGSSMGGWIALLAARARPERVAAVVGLAAAPDFTVDLWNSFTETQKKSVEEEGIVYIPNGWTEEGDPWTRELFRDAENYLLLKDGRPLDITCPVTLVQGGKDDCVPVDTAFKIMTAAKTDAVKVVILKNSGHRLSEPDELAVLEKELSVFLG